MSNTGNNQTVLKLSLNTPRRLNGELLKPEHDRRHRNSQSHAK